MKVLRTRIGSSNTVASLARQIAHYSVGVFIPAGVALASSAIFTRMFGVADFGIYSLVVTAIGLISAVASQWLQQGVNRYLPGSQVESHLIQATIHGVLMTGLTVTLVLVPLVLAVMPTHEYHAYVLPALATVILQIYTNVLGTILQARLQSSAYAKIQSLVNFLRFILGLLFAMFLMHSPVALVWAGVISYIFAAVLLTLKSGTVSAFSSGKTFAGEMNVQMWIKKMYGYGFPMAGYFAASLLLGFSDRFVIGFTRGYASAGLYSASYNLISNGLGLLISPLIVAVHPFLMKVWASEDRARLGKIMTQLSSLVISAGIILVGLTVVAYRDVANILLGSAFRQGASIMPIVAAGIAAMSFANYAHKPFEFQEKTVLMMLVGLGVAVSNVVMNLYFVPLYGYKSAAWTTLASYGLYALVTYLIGQRLFQWAISWKIPLISLGVSLVAVLVTSVITIFTNQSYPILRLLIDGGSYFSIVVGSLWTTYRRVLKDVQGETA